MVKIFAGREGLKSRSLFRERKRYKENIVDAEIDFLDTWYDSPRYGLLNQGFETVIYNPGDDGENLKDFGDYAAVGIQGSPFVVDAFNDFRSVYLQYINESAISSPKFMDNLVPKKAYLDFEEHYTAHGLAEMEHFGRYLNDNKGKVVSFQDYIGLLFQYLEHKPERPIITKTGFLLSNQCPINVSGLCVELADLPYSEDFNKGRIIQTEEFRCFSDAAKEVGFYIDKNAPWRLIANLESEAMTTRLKKYEPDTTVDNILSRVFRSKTCYDDLDALISFCKSSYRSFVLKSPFYSYREYSERKSKYIYKKAFRSSIIPRIPIEYWLSLLLRLRMLELGMPLEDYGSLEAEVLDTHALYSVKYTDRPLKPALGKIGQYTSMFLENLEMNREVVSSTTTRLKDYFDITDS